MNKKTHPAASERVRTAWPTAHGAVVRAGDPRIASFLEQALLAPEASTVAWEQMHSPEGEALFSTHLFHGYTGRTHPLIVRALLSTQVAGGKVLDPFVGSGTTLVEAEQRGLAGLGLDVSPLAVRLARWKTHPLDEASRDAAARVTQEITANALERVRKKQAPKRRWDHIRFYPPHVYHEMCGLREEIETAGEQHPAVRETLLLAFSSVVIKCSKQAGASSVQMQEKHIGRGQVTRWLERRVAQALRLHAELASRIPTGTPLPCIQQADARTWKVSSDIAAYCPVDVLLTSPPYLGIYNYEFHAQRSLAWIGDPEGQSVDLGEMASRRQSQRGPLSTVLSQHAQDTLAWVQRAHAVLRPGAVAYILVGDSDLWGRRIDGKKPILQAAAHVGWRWQATCSIERIDPHARRQDSVPRLEHVLCFERIT